jgi:predicted aspartyl protease
VKLNGQHVGEFIIDTGAMCSALDREAAQKLGLIPGKRLRDMKGSKLRRPDGLYHIDSLDIGGGAGGGATTQPIAGGEGGAMTQPIARGGNGATSQPTGGGVSVRNHVIAVVDLSSVRRRNRPNLAGVLGADVWAMMPFTVDCRAQEVVFHARPQFHPPPTDRAVLSSMTVARELKAPAPFSMANPRAGAPSVPVTINGGTTDAMLDTGSGSSIVLLPRLIAQRPELVRGDRFVARAAGAGGASGLAGFGLVGANVESIDALGVRFTDIDSALAIIDDLPNDKRSSAIVGTRLLAHLRLTFDYANEKVWAEVK